MKSFKGIVTAAVVLGTIAGMTGSAFADNSTTANTSVTSSTTNSTNEIAGSTTLNPTPVSPDSYLYFVTQVTQAIHVALASSDVQKAQLLAQYGQQQIAQANALLQSGQTDSAKQLLAQAVTNQLLAVDTSNTVTQSGQASTGDVAGIKGEVSGNISALAQALQNVNNPKAKAALEKNIEKAFKHLEKRLQNIGKESTADNADAIDNSDASATGDTHHEHDNQQSGVTEQTTANQDGHESHDEGASGAALAPNQTNPSQGGSETSHGEHGGNYSNQGQGQGSDTSNGSND